MRKPKSSFSSLKKCSEAWTDPFALVHIVLANCWKKTWTCLSCLIFLLLCFFLVQVNLNSSGKSSLAEDRESGVYKGGKIDSPHTFASEKLRGDLSNYRVLRDEFSSIFDELNSGAGYSDLYFSRICSTIDSMSVQDFEFFSTIIGDSNLSDINKISIESFLLGKYSSLGRTREAMAILEEKGLMSFGGRTLLAIVSQSSLSLSEIIEIGKSFDGDASRIMSAAISSNLESNCCSLSIREVTPELLNGPFGAAILNGLAMSLQDLEGFDRPRFDEILEKLRSFDEKAAQKHSLLLVENLASALSLIHI